MIEMEHISRAMKAKQDSNRIIAAENKQGFRGFINRIKG
jgi:hypothetical protein